MRELFIKDSRCLDDDIITLIQDEHVYQIDKHGAQFAPATEWLAYLTEEVGELSKAILDYQYQDGPIESVVSEAVQVMTLAAKIATCKKISVAR